MHTQRAKTGGAEGAAHILLTQIMATETSATATSLAAQDLTSPSESAASAAESLLREIATVENPGRMRGSARLSQVLRLHTEMNGTEDEGEAARQLLASILAVESPSKMKGDKDKRLSSALKLAGLGGCLSSGEDASSLPTGDNENNDMEKTSIQQRAIAAKELLGAILESENTGRSLSLPSLGQEDKEIREAQRLLGELVNQEATGLKPAVIDPKETARNTQAARDLLSEIVVQEIQGRRGADEKFRGTTLNTTDALNQARTLLSTIINAEQSGRSQALAEGFKREQSILEESNNNEEEQGGEVSSVDIKAETQSAMETARELIAQLVSTESSGRDIPREAIPYLKDKATSDAIAEAKELLQQILGSENTQFVKNSFGSIPEPPSDILNIPTPPSTAVGTPLPSSPYNRSTVGLQTGGPNANSTCESTNIGNILSDITNNKEIQNDLLVNGATISNISPSVIGMKNGNETAMGISPIIGSRLSISSNGSVSKFDNNSLFENQPQITVNMVTVPETTFNGSNGINSVIETKQNGPNNGGSDSFSDDDLFNGRLNDDDNDANRGYMGADVEGGDGGSDSGDDDYDNGPFSQNNTTAKRSLWAIIFACLISGLALFSDGYQNGIVGFINLIFPIVGGEDFFDDLSTRISSSAIAGQILGQLAFGYIVDRFGRKVGLVSCTILVTLGALVSAIPFSSHFVTTATIITAARFVLGIGVGGEYPCSSASASETADSVSQTRRGGIFIMVTNFVLDGGFVFSAILPTLLLLAFGYRHPNGDNHLNDGVNYDAIWRIALGFGALPPMLILYSRIKHLNQEKFEKNAIKHKIPWSLILRKYWKRLLVTSGIWFFYDFVAYPASFFWSRIISTAANSSDILAHQSWGILLYSFYLPGALTGALLVDKIGRRKTMTLGFTGQAVLAGIISIGYVKLSESCFPLFVILYGLYLSSGEMGPGDCIGLVSSEVYPTAVRGKAYGISAAVGKIGALVGTSVFVPISKHFTNPDIPNDPTGDRITFIIGGVLCLVGAILTKFYLPDFMSRSLDDEDDEFREYLRENGYHEALGTSS